MSGRAHHESRDLRIELSVPDRALLPRRALQPGALEADAGGGIRPRHLDRRAVEQEFDAGGRRRLGARGSQCFQQRADSARPVIGLCEFPAVSTAESGKAAGSADTCQSGRAAHFLQFGQAESAACAGPRRPTSRIRRMACPASASPGCGRDVGCSQLFR